MPRVAKERRIRRKARKARQRERRRKMWESLAEGLLAQLEYPARFPGLVTVRRLSPDDTLPD